MGVRRKELGRLRLAGGACKEQEREGEGDGMNILT